MSEISRDEVAHLAMLSRLALSEDELQLFAEQIDEIVGAVSAVQKVDTEGVEPMSHPHSIATAMRDDVDGFDVAVDQPDRLRELSEATRGVGEQDADEIRHEGQADLSSRILQWSDFNHRELSGGSVRIPQISFA